MHTGSGFISLRRALISTFDKSGLLPLCKLLCDAKVEIISTGNTAGFLREHSIPVIDVEQVTQFPEILDGRVKTLHPMLFSAILACRDKPSHMDTLKTHQIAGIDLVIVNLYPFESSQNIENIDVGGPSLLRAAAKNFKDVVVLSDPSQYSDFISQYSERKGIHLAERREWAASAFMRTARYDQAIAAWFSGKELRYGENPHQKAHVIGSHSDEIPLASVLPLQGKELSYNNLLDAHAAILSLRCLMSAKDSSNKGCIIVKHGTPCGAAMTDELPAAVANAFASDPISAFGGVISLSGTVDAKVAAVLKPHFIEIIIAPEFNDEALAILSQKKDLRLVQIPTLLSGQWPKESMRSIFGGYLIQEFDTPSFENPLEVVTQKSPEHDKFQDLEMANHLAIPCLSNAITIVSKGQLIGVGAGQTSRIDAVKIAIAKAREHGHSLLGAALASDGFFPFADSLLVAKEAGITSIIQPGGSKRDEEVIAKANELGLSMIFTRARHFRH